jgi:hypothetical protein
MFLYGKIEQIATNEHKKRHVKTIDEFEYLVIKKGLGF